VYRESVHFMQEVKAMRSGRAARIKIGIESNGDGLAAGESLALLPANQSDRRARPTSPLGVRVEVLRGRRHVAVAERGARVSMSVERTSAVPTWSAPSL
jgi:hypothetical protein